MAIPRAELAQPGPTAERQLSEIKKHRETGGRKHYFSESVDFEAFSRSDRDEVKLTRRLYQRLDNTQEWAENNYYRLPIEKHNANLITVNAFWNDYANRDTNAPSSQGIGQHPLVTLQR